MCADTSTTRYRGMRPSQSVSVGLVDLVSAKGKSRTLVAMSRYALRMILFNRNNRPLLDWRRRWDFDSD